jgi:hypothetical protein
MFADYTSAGAGFVCRTEYATSWSDEFDWISYQFTVDGTVLGLLSQMGNQIYYSRMLLAAKPACLNPTDVRNTHHGTSCGSFLSSFAPFFDS